MLRNLGIDAASVAAEITFALPDNMTCVCDERDLNLPGALLSLERAAFDRLDAETVTATWKIYLIERDQGGPLVALTKLGEYINAIQDQLGIIGDFEPEAIMLPNHSADYLPAIQFTFTTELTNQ